MTLRILALRLRVRTSDGSAGATVTFRDGLNVIRGANSRGKTQVLQAIIYGLGLEGLFGPGSNTRLGSALTQSIRLFGSDGLETDMPVVASWCALEISNGSEILTACRPIKWPLRSHNLVRIWNGPAITTDEATEVGDYFVRESGSLQHAVGYHNLLSDFIGWHLPSVARYTGGQTILYPEILAPFFYVDQRSWGSAAPRPVTYLQVKEPSRKAVEFLLALEGPAFEVRRSQLDEEISALKTRWSTVLEGAKGSSSLVGARLVGVPDLPAGARPGSRGDVVASTLVEAGLEVLNDGEWRPAVEVAESLRELAATQIAARVENVTIGGIGAEQLQDSLRSAERELGDVLAATTVIEQNLLLNEAQLAALDRRIDALLEEEARNRDVRTLLRLGSQHSDTHLADESCPTCHQALSAIESSELGPVLDVESTSSLLLAQTSTARGMREQAQAAVTQSRDAYGALQRDADRIRMQIRSIKTDLESPEDSLSSSDIARRIIAEGRLDELTRAIDATRAALSTLEEIAAATARARSELNSLPRGIPEADERLLSELTSRMRRQLEDFGFDSYSADQVSLDPDTLRPERSGFDLDADVSASDVVRVKIAYLNAIREYSTEAGGNHPGLLMLDEPRQHEMDERNFRTTLARLSRSAAQGDQVIVTSAASAEEVTRMIGEEPSTLIDLGSERLLRREPSEGREALERFLFED